MKTIIHIIRKEFLQIRRDKRMLALSILAPVIQLVLLGYAATTDIRDIPMLLVNQDKSSVSREVILLSKKQSIRQTRLMNLLIMDMFG
jgi:ABC-2 type transport system permease protein